MSDCEISTPQEHKLASKEVNKSAVEEEKVDVDTSAENKFATESEKDNSMESKDEIDGYSNSIEPNIQKESRPYLLGGNYSCFLRFLE